MNNQESAIHSSMTPIEWAMLIALSMVFGGSFFFVGVIVKELPPMTIVLTRVVLAALILLVFMRATGRHLPTGRPVWAAFFTMGLLNNVIPFCLIVYGQTQIAAGVASILNATTPLFTVLVAHMLTSDEKMTPMRLSGVVVGFLGVAAMIGGGAKAQGIGTAIAQLACLFGALSYGFAAVFGRRFKTMNINPIAVATGQLTASSIMMLPLVLIIDQPWSLPIPSAHAVLALIGLAALSTAFAYILYFKILSGAGATNLSLVTFLVPASAIFLGIFFLGEILLSRHLFGLAMICIGLMLVDGRLFKAANKRTA